MIFIVIILYMKYNFINIAISSVNLKPKQEIKYYAKKLVLGSPTFTMEKGNEITVITEEDFNAAFENYSNAVVVNFADGASNATR